MAKKAKPSKKGAPKTTAELIAEINAHLDATPDVDIKNLEKDKLTRKEARKIKTGIYYNLLDEDGIDNYTPMTALLTASGGFLRGIVTRPVKVLEETIFLALCLFVFAWAVIKRDDSVQADIPFTIDLSANILVILFIVILVMIARLFYFDDRLRKILQKILKYLLPVLIIALISRLFYLGVFGELIVKLWGYLMGLLDSIIYFVIPQALTLL